MTTDPLERLFRPHDDVAEATADIERAFARADRAKAAANGDGNGHTESETPEQTPSQNTDVGNAERFTRKNRLNARYCHERGQWLPWTSTRWQWDKTGRSVALAKETALSIFDEARDAQDIRQAEALSRWAISSQKRERIVAMLALAQPDLAITVDQLDADKDALNFQNGTVDLKTGRLRPHRRENFITKLCPVNYSPDAPHTTFDRFLARIFRSTPTLIDWMQVALGYAATGWTREQCVFFCYGVGANGKTTLIDAVLHGMGDYAAKADPDLLMARDGSSAHPCNVADLLGLRLAICSETNEGKRFDESRLKDLTGETMLKARFMRQNFFQFTATHKIFAYSNHKPTVRGTDQGFWRRMRVVPFLETIGLEERDSDLPRKLRAEAEGIMAWIVAGAVRWHREGLGNPPEVAAATNEYRAEMDSIGAFLAEHCDERKNAEVYAAEIYDSYRKWAEKNGEHALSQKRLGTSLKERGFLSARCTYSGRSKWLGIDVKREVSA
jgi:putative DNA primase/helicase